MTTLSRREREIVDALYALGEGDVEDVRARMAAPPGYDAVRTTLRILEGKGVVRRHAVGRRHVYRPVQSRGAALKGAWRNLVQTYFGGSYKDAAAALLAKSDIEAGDEKLAGLRKDIDASRRRRGKP